MTLLFFFQVAVEELMSAEQQFYTRRETITAEENVYDSDLVL